MFYAPQPQMGQPWGPGMYWPGSPQSGAHLAPQPTWQPYYTQYYQYPAHAVMPGMRQGLIPGGTVQQQQQQARAAAKAGPHPPPLNPMHHTTPRSPLSPTLSLDKQGRQNSSGCLPPRPLPVLEYYSRSYSACHTERLGLVLAG